MTRRRAIHPVLRLGTYVLRRVAGGCYLAIALLFRICRIRLITLTHPDRIGHLCVEPDCFIKEGILKRRPRFFAIFLIPRNRVANHTMLNLWRKHLTVVTSPKICAVLEPLLGHASVRYHIDHYAVAIDSTAACAAIFAQWNGRPPLLDKTSVGSQTEWEALYELGLPPGSWFVCVQSRDGHYSLHDEHMHSYRNSSISNYLPAMAAIVERGGWCIRVGEPTPIPLPGMPGVIDYANSDKKSQLLDIFLCANCRFFLGSTSGLLTVSTVFGVHSALANIVPISGALPSGYDDIGIPKLLRSKQTGDLLAYRNVLQTPVANFRFTWQYENAGILVEENSAEDIRDLALEMLDRYSRAITYDAEDEQLQNQFHDLIRLGHYTFGAHSRIGRNFLRKYARLVQSRPVPDIGDERIS